MRSRIVFVMILIGLPLISRAEAPATSNLTVNNVKVQGTLDLDNNVSIRWKKPDGSRYVNIFSLDKNGTLKLCNDPYFFQSNDAEHLAGKVIEVRNPNSAYPDFRLPITRSNNINGDSKLLLRSLSLIETNDPSEINLLRTGTDDPKEVDENGVIANGAVTGIIRWMGRRTKTADPNSYGGYTTVAELIGRSYGTSDADAHGAVMLQVIDKRSGRQGDSGIIAFMKHGVRIGELLGSPGDGMTGSMLEVDSTDNRPILFRRSDAAPGKSVSIALATGEGGKPLTPENTLAVIKSEPAGNKSSRVEIQTNRGGRLETDLILPAPAAQASSKRGQAIPSGELVPVSFDVTHHDTDSMRDATSKTTTRLTCRTAGRYSISAAVEFESNGNGSRQVIVRRNGRDTVGAMRVAPVVSETTQMTFTAPPAELMVGDFVELFVRQTSGESLELLSDGEIAPTLSVNRVG